MATIRMRKRDDGGTSWQVRIKYTHRGEQKTENRTFSDKKFKRRDAEAWARQRETEIAHGASFSKAHATTTLAELTQRYIHEYERTTAWGKTKASDLRHLMTYSIARRPAVQLRARDFIEHVKLRRESGTGPATVNNDLIWWRIVYKIAIGAWDMPLSTDPIDSAALVCRQHRLIEKPNRRSRRPTMGELDTLLDHAADADARLQAPMVDIILFQIFSARRIAETCRITWADYDQAKAIVIVRNMKDPKKTQGNDIEVALPGQAIAIIERQPRNQARIFPYNPSSVGSYFARACKVNAITDLRLHDLRHEGTSWLFETGLDIPRVSKITGHRSWGCLQRYAHLEKIEHFDKYRGWKWLRSNRPARLKVV